MCFSPSLKNLGYDKRDSGQNFTINSFAINIVVKRFFLNLLLRLQFTYNLHFLSLSSLKLTISQNQLGKLSITANLDTFPRNRYTRYASLMRNLAKAQDYLNFKRSHRQTSVTSRGRSDSNEIIIEFSIFRSKAGKKTTKTLLLGVDVRNFENRAN